MTKKFTVSDFKKVREEGRRFSMITCYDYTIASLVDRSTVDGILVGDSIGNVVYGYRGTNPVTMDQMVLATQAVVKGAPHTLVMGDMPFGSYNTSREEAVENANRLMKEGGCDLVKLEGGVEVADKIEAIVKAGIPVMGHIGVTPQTAASLGGMRIQGKTLDTAKKLLDDIRAIEAAGACSCGIECVPNCVGELLEAAVTIPVFSAGAGPKAQGFGFNFFDLTGFFQDFKPKFCRKYADVGVEIVEAMNRFHADIISGAFPGPQDALDVDIPGLENL